MGRRGADASRRRCRLHIAREFWRRRSLSRPPAHLQRLRRPPRPTLLLAVRWPLRRQLLSRVPPPFSRCIMDSTTITHTNGTTITTVSTAAPRPLAKQISGTAISKEIREEMKREVMALQAEHGVTPGLAVVLVGDRPDSATYVRMKKKAAAEIGFHSVDVTLPDTATTDEVLEAVNKLNEDPTIHGILVQLPLPAQCDEPLILKTIAVHKDADGFSAMNIGNLCLKGGDPPLAVPCTPAGCIELLQRSGYGNLSGKNAVVIGRSNIVGMPVGSLLQSMNATVTTCHSRTADIPSYLANADIVVAAIGKAEFVKGEWLKPGCVVIDVGINDKEDKTKKRGYRMVGDCDFESCQKVASAITPVPGGVGPMTIAMLMKNTVNLARHSVGLPRMVLRKDRRPSMPMAVDVKA